MWSDNMEEARQRRSSMLLYACMALFMFVFMVRYSGVQEFWYDEVYQLGMVRDSQDVKGLFREYAQLKDYTPPLYALICYFWVRVVPFSFRWLLLISEGFVALGVFVTSLVGERVGGRKIGLLTGIFAATSSVLVLSAGYEFRSYSLYFMAAAFVFLLLAKRVQNPDRGVFVKYGLALVLLLYSHYYGAVLFAVLFLLEIMFAVCRRIKWSSLVVYIVSGAAFLPWMLLVFVYRTRSMTEFWIQPPDLMSVIELFQYLCSENSFVLGLLGLGTALTAVSLASRCRKRAFAYEIDGMWVYLLGTVVGVVVVMYVYGAYVNPGGGLFYKRYFLGLLPCCFVILGAGTAWLVDLLAAGQQNRKYIFAVISLALVLVLSAQNGEHFWGKIEKKPALSYTGAVRSISRCEDITSSDVAVVTTDNPWVRAGIEIYFDRLFQIKPVILSQHDEAFAGQVRKYRKLYVFKGKQPMTEQTEQMLRGYKQMRKMAGKRVYEYERKPE